MSGIRKTLILQNLIKLGLEDVYKIHVLGQVDSTSRWVKNHIDKAPSNHIVCVADSQTAGVGRTGRQWVSPAASNIYFSFSWELEPNLSDFSAVSLVIGIAVVRTLSSLGVDGLGIKWPNDIFLNGKKLAGVLIELRQSAEKKYLVIGVGINVQMPAKTSIESTTGWTDLTSTQLGIERREEVIARLLLECRLILPDFVKHGFKLFRGEWMRLDVWQGQWVDILDNGEVRCSGIESGVDEKGFLLLKSGDKLIPVASGDVSLRVRND